jgi:hypothetical protein
MFGFITMTPQLFINYKLKSVSFCGLSTLWRKLALHALLSTFVFHFIRLLTCLGELSCTSRSIPLLVKIIPHCLTVKMDRVN